MSQAPGADTMDDAMCAVERIPVDIPKEWLTVADVCAYLRVTPYVVTKMLRQGRLTGVKIGREWRVARTDLEDWINRERGAAP